MRVVGVVLARMGSARFPGKSMSLIQGKSLIELITERVRQCVVCEVPLILATTSNSEDDQLEDHARNIGIETFRGSASDVLSRAISASSQLGGTHLLRLNGDCPLVEPELIDEALMELIENNPKVVTSKRENHLPYGISVEITRLDILENLRHCASELEKEHIFNAVYNTVDRSELSVVGSKFPHRPDLKLTVDFPSDHSKIEAMINESGISAEKVKYWQVPLQDRL